MDLIEINPFPNVPEDGPARLVTDQLKGMSVHAIIFEQGGTDFTKAMLTSIRIGQGTKNYCPALTTGSQLQDLNEFDGLSSTSNYITFYFGDPTARTIRGQHLGDLDCSIYPSPIEIETMIAGADTPTLKCYALVGVPKMQMGLGYTEAEAASVRALIRSFIELGGAVSRKVEQVGLGSGVGARIRKIGFFHDGDLTKVMYKKQGVEKWPDVSDALNDFIQTDFGRVPQANLYVLDRVVDGNQGEADPTLAPNGSAWNLQIALTSGAATPVTAFADVYTMPALL